MAEAILFPIAELIIETLGSAAVQEIKSLWNVEDELQELEDTLSTIKAVLIDTEKRQIHEEQVRVWLQRLKDVVYLADDLVDDIVTEGLQQRQVMMPGKKKKNVVKKVRTFFSGSNQLVFRHKMAKKIKDVRNTLERIAADRRFHLRENTSEEVAKVVRNPRETHSFVLRESVIGRDGDKNEIIRLLLESCADHEHKVDHQEKVSVIPIVGMGGVGKTTLIQLVFNDESVQKHFDLKIWVCVSENFDEELLMEKIVKIAGDVSTKDLELEQLQRNLRKELAGKRYLLVLDDMWNENPRKWQNLKDLLTDCGEGSRIIVTTRSKIVANLMSTSIIKPYELGILNLDNSWSLFKKLAFEQGCQEQASSSILDVAKEIVKKCGGVPLAISMIGSMLYQRNPKTDWPSFLQNELSNISTEENDILKTLKLSYDYLPSHLKRCFAFCQLFPKDYKIDVGTMVTLWIAQAFIKSSDGSQSLEDIGYGYFLELLWRSFFQEDERDEMNKVKTCKMHDLVHGLAIQVAKGEYVTVKSGEENIHRKIRNVSFELKLKSLEEVPISLLQAKTLRSILLPNPQYPHEEKLGESICDLIVANFKFLRTLDLNSLWIKILPNTIGKLKHLRYLDLSNNFEMKKLPASITKLVNLQTLKLSWCNGLEELPEDIHKLVNLRHLELFNCGCVRHMPRGLSQLTNLRTLPRFVLSDDNGVGKLDELAGLNNLGGELEISGLRSGIETKTAKLKEKQNLQSLYLRWDLLCRYNDNASSSNSNEKWEMTIEGLQPHQNLRELTLDNYMGVKLSSWLPLLTNLVDLHLCLLPRCQQLPPLNQFPRLKKMRLSGLLCLEYIINDDVGGSEFLKSSSSSTRTVGSIHISSSLQQLELVRLPELKGWWRVDDIADDDENQVVLPSFPCLSELTIEGCPKLTCMPLYPNVERLTLRETSWKTFEQTGLMSANTTTFTVENHIEASSSSSSSSSAFSTPVVSSSPLSKLGGLYLGLCSDVDPPESLPNWMKCLTYLKELKIKDNDKLKYLSPGIQYLTSLQKTLY